MPTVLNPLIIADFSLFVCLVHRWLVDLPDDSLDGTRSATLAMLRTLLFTGQTMLPLDQAVLEGGDHPCCYLVMKISHTVPEGAPDIVLKNFQKVEGDKCPFEGETVKVSFSRLYHFKFFASALSTSCSV